MSTLFDDPTVTVGFVCPNCHGRHRVDVPPARIGRPAAKAWFECPVRPLLGPVTVHLDESTAT